MSLNQLQNTSRITTKVLFFFGGGNALQKASFMRKHLERGSFLLLRFLGHSGRIDTNEVICSLLFFVVVLHLAINTILMLSFLRHFYAKFGMMGFRNFYLRLFRWYIALAGGSIYGWYNRIKALTSRKTQSLQFFQLKNHAHWQWRFSSVG